MIDTNTNHINVDEDVLTFETAYSRGILTPERTYIVERSTGVTYEFKESIEIGLVEIEAGLVVDTSSGEKYSFSEAKNKGLVRNAPRPFLDLLTAAENGILDFDEKRIIHPSTKSLMTITQAIADGIIDPKSEITEHDGRSISLQEAIRNGILNTDTLDLLLPGGKLLSISDCLGMPKFNSARRRSSIMARKCSLTLDEAISSGIYDPVSNSVMSREGFLSLPKALQAGLIHNDSLLRDPFSGDILSMKEALEKRLLDPESGKMIDSHGIPIALNFAMEKGLILKSKAPLHLSLAEALDEGLFNISSNQFVNPDTNEEINVLTALEIGIVDIDLIKIRDTASGEILNLEMAVERGILDLEEGMCVSTADGERLNVVDGMDKGIILDTSSQPAMSLLEAIDENLMEVSTCRFKDPVGSYEMNLEEALESNFIDRMSISVRDVKMKTLLTIDGAINRGLVNNQTGIFKTDDTDQGITFQEAFNNCLIFSDAFVPAKSLLEAIKQGLYNRKTGKFIDPSSGRVWSLRDMIVEGYIEPDTFLVLDSKSNMLLTFEEAQNAKILDPKVGMILDTESNELLNLREALDRGLLQENIQSITISLQQAIDAGLLQNNYGRIMDPLSRKPLSVQKAIEIGLADVSQLLVSVNENGKYLFFDDACHEGIVFVDDDKLVYSRTADSHDIVSAFNKNILIEIPEGGFLLGDVLSSGLYDEKNQRFLDPFSGNKITLADAVKSGVINEDKPQVAVPDLGIFSLKQAVDKGLIDPNTGNYIASNMPFSLTDAVDTKRLLVAQHKQSEEEFKQSISSLCSSEYIASSSLGYISSLASTKSSFTSIKSSTTSISRDTEVSMETDSFSSSFQSSQIADSLHMSEIGTNYGNRQEDENEMQGAVKDIEIIKVQKITESLFDESQDAAADTSSSSNKFSKHVGEKRKNEIDVSQEIESYPLSDQIKEPLQGAVHFSDSLLAPKVAVLQTVPDDFPNSKYISNMEVDDGNEGNVSRKEYDVDIKTDDYDREKHNAPTEETEGSIGETDAKDLSPKSNNIKQEAQQFPEGLDVSFTESEASIPVTFDEDSSENNKRLFYERSQSSCSDNIYKNGKEKVEALLKNERSHSTNDLEDHFGVFTTSRKDEIMKDLQSRWDPPDDALSASLDSMLQDAIRNQLIEEKPLSLFNAIEKGIYDDDTSLFWDPETGNIQNLLDAIETGLIDSSYEEIISSDTEHPLTLQEAIEATVIDGERGKFLDHHTGAVLTLKQARDVGLIFKEKFSPRNTVVINVEDNSEKDRQQQFEDAFSSGILHRSNSQVIDPDSVQGIPLRRATSMGLIDMKSGNFKNPQTGETMSLAIAVEKGYILSPKGLSLFSAVDQGLYYELTGQFIHPSTGATKCLDDLIVDRVIATSHPEIRDLTQENIVTLGDAIKKSIINSHQGTYVHPVSKEGINFKDAISAGLIFSTTTREGLPDHRRQLSPSPVPCRGRCASLSPMRDSQPSKQNRPVGFGNHLTPDSIPEITHGRTHASLTKHSKFPLNDTPAVSRGSNLANEAGVRSGEGSESPTQRLSLSDEFLDLPERKPKLADEPLNLEIPSGEPMTLSDEFLKLPERYPKEQLHSDSSKDKSKHSWQEKVNPCQNDSLLNEKGRSDDLGKGELAKNHKGLKSELEGLKVENTKLQNQQTDISECGEIVEYPELEQNSSFDASTGPVINRQGFDSIQKQRKGKAIDVVTQIPQIHPVDFNNGFPSPSSQTIEFKNQLVEATQPVNFGLADQPDKLDKTIKEKLDSDTHFAKQTQDSNFHSVAKTQNAQGPFTSATENLHPQLTAKVDSTDYGKLTGLQGCYEHREPDSENTYLTRIEEGSVDDPSDYLISPRESGRPEGIFYSPVVNALARDDLANMIGTQEQKNGKEIKHTLASNHDAKSVSSVDSHKALKATNAMQPSRGAKTVQDTKADGENCPLSISMDSNNESHLIASEMQSPISLNQEELASGKQEESPVTKKESPMITSHNSAEEITEETSESILKDKNIPSSRAKHGYRVRFKDVPIDANQTNDTNNTDRVIPQENDKNQAEANVAWEKSRSEGKLRLALNPDLQVVMKNEIAAEKDKVSPEKATADKAKLRPGVLHTDQLKGLGVEPVANQPQLDVASSLSSPMSSEPEASTPELEALRLTDKLFKLNLKAGATARDRRKVYSPLLYILLFARNSRCIFCWMRFAKL